MGRPRQRKVEVTLPIKSSSTNIIKAFTDPTMLKNWWNVERCLIDKQQGGVYTLVWGILPERLQYISSGIIKEYDENHVLHVENFIYVSTERPVLGPMDLRIVVWPRNTGNEINLVQSGYQEGVHWDWYYLAVKAAWPKMIAHLKKYLEQ